MKNQTVMGKALLMAIVMIRVTLDEAERTCADLWHAWMTPTEKHQVSRHIVHSTWVFGSSLQPERQLRPQWRPGYLSHYVCVGAALQRCDHAGHTVCFEP